MQQISVEMNEKLFSQPGALNNISLCVYTMEEQNENSKQTLCTASVVSFIFLGQ